MSFLGKVMGRAEAHLREDGLALLEEADFQKLCAPYEDGTLYIAKGYQQHEDLHKGLKSLRFAGLIPKDSSKKIIVSLEDIRGHYERGDDAQASARAQLSDSTSALQKLQALLERAAKLRASDVKIAQFGHATHLRLRVAGRDMVLEEEWTLEDGLSAMTAAFNAREDGGGHTAMALREFQSFSISRDHKKDGKLKLPANVVKLRGQKGHQENTGSLGNHLVLRLFYDDQDDETGRLEDLGLDQDVLDELEFERGIEDGCVIIGGTTGNGKSTTLINLVNQIYEDAEGAVSIVTFEDPVETPAKGDILQIPILSKGSEEDIGLAWRNALRHLVRINPDVGVLGEMRDGASAEEALKFVASGHKVLSTAHVGSANTIPFRLINWGVAATEVGAEGALSLLMRQVLLPKLCDHCKQPASDKILKQVKKSLLRADAAQSDANLRARINAADLTGAGIFMRNKDGCSHCVPEGSDDAHKSAWAGYARMIAVAEFIRPDETYRNAVIARNSQEAYSHWIKPREEGGLGGITVDSRLARKVLAGGVDFLDARRRARSIGSDLLAELQSKGVIA